MSVGQTYQVKVTQELAAQQVLNVYYYQQTAVASGGTNDAEALANAWIDMVFNTQKAICSNQLTFVSVEALCLSNDLDFWTELFDPGATGSINSESLPPFNAWAFIYIRESRASRNGWKRIAGVPETGQNNGVVVAGTVGVLEVHAATLRNPLTSVSYGGAWEPKIYRRSTNAIFAVSDVQYKRITSQLTRKFTSPP